jgi:2-oxoglutarate dehydrogenase E1 component
MFHLLRRQMKQPFRKPLIVFTPKSLLRHPLCVSSLDDLIAGTFKEALLVAPDPALIRRVLICSGKIYYDLLDGREKHEADDTAIIRIEQLYPFAADTFTEILKQLPANASIAWVQEEPENMGAWPHLRLKLTDLCGSIRYIGRPEDCCPAVASHHLHAEEQAAIVKAAFNFK